MLYCMEATIVMFHGVVNLHPRLDFEASDCGD